MAASATSSHWKVASPIEKTCRSQYAESGLRVEVVAMMVLAADYDHTDFERPVRGWRGMRNHARP
jgi:hypothetical protein